MVFLAVVAVVAVLTILYVVVRLVWRLRREESVPAGRDSDALQRDSEGS
jgi:hypothetical protein